MILVKTFTTELSIPVLFEAWISPEMVIPPIVKIEVLPKVDGHFVLHAQSDTGISIMRGAFLKIEQNNEIKYTWNWEGSEETTIVTVNFIPGTEANTVQVSQEGFLSEESKALHDSGWDHYFSELEKKLQL